MALKIVGTGPGSIDEMTARAGRAIREADIIVGYTLYNELLQKEFPDKEYYATTMRHETERCRYALEKAAQGLETVLVCSGDSGVYGMASLVFELAEQMYGRSCGEACGKADDNDREKNNMASQDHEKCPEIEVIPGITAALSGGARLGSPLSNDFAVVSLSDLLTPWDVIEKRLRGAADGDFVIALYNPGSKKRRDHLKKACDIVMERRGAETPCGIVRNIGRDGEHVDIMTLGELRNVQADMFMTVFIGNSATRVIGGRLVTPRGYVENGRTESVRRERSRNLNYGAGDTVLIFGGTTEGRILAERAARSGARVVLSVATDYGEEVLEDIQDMEGLELHKGHLDTGKMISLIDDAKPCAVFDATHPYANEVTASVSAAAAAVGVRYVRVRRDIGAHAADPAGSAAPVPDVSKKTAPPAGRASAPNGAPAAPQHKGAPAASVPDVKAAPDSSAVPCMGTGAAGGAADITYVPDVSAAAAVLNRTAARAFITTGSRGAAAFGKVKDAENRLTIRVLPSEEAVKLCREAGFKGKNIICMQGPFSAELNEAMFRAAGAEILVTKSSGKTGGFPEKTEAARRLGMKVIVIAPPDDMPGITLEAACAMFG